MGLRAKKRGRGCTFSQGVLFTGLLNGWEVEQELGSGHQALSGRVDCIPAYGFNLRYGLFLGGLGLCERGQRVSFQRGNSSLRENALRRGVVCAGLRFARLVKRVKIIRTWWFETKEPPRLTINSILIVEFESRRVVETRDDGSLEV